MAFDAPTIFPVTRASCVTTTLPSALMLPDAVTLPEAITLIV